MPTMPKQTLVVAVATFAIAVAAIAVLGLFVGGLGNGKFQPPSISPQQKTPPSGRVPISTQVPVQIETLRGMVTAASTSSLTVKGASGTKTFSLAQVTDVQNLTSGTLEGGDAKTTPSSVSNLKTGQEVLVVTDKGTLKVRSILIIK